jgi:1-acyl-sn-glycerol-3-phosphate acyltransferase
MPSSFGYGLSVQIVRIFLAPFTRRRVIGVRHVPQRGACILAPNHISHFDPPLIGISTTRPVDWMAMQELFTNRIFRGILRWIGSFPVGREKLDRAAVRTALERLKHERLIGVFPEGGLRTGRESVLEGAPLKPGVAAMAQMTGATVIPCVVIGSDALYAPRQWLPFRRTRVWVVFGPPLIQPAAEGDKAAARANFETLLGETLRDLYARTVREENIPADCLPQTAQRRKGQS